MTEKIITQYSQVIPAMQGAVAQTNVNSTPVVIDITTLPSNPAVRNVPPNANANLGQATVDPDQYNPVGKYVRITASSNTVYYAVGSNYAALANINAAAFSTINGTTGQVTTNGQEGEPIAAGAWVDVYITMGGTPRTQNPPGANSPCRYLALVTSGSNTATATIRQSSG
jgi:hypothetical protein